MCEDEFYYAHKLVDFIHESDLYGCFVEMGAGTPVSKLLFDVEGASNTVRFSYSPYAKDIQRGLSRYRSVSKEFLNEYQASLIEKSFDAMEVTYNTVYMSSYQIGKDICNHGWVYLNYKGDIRYYHVYIHKFYGDRYSTIEDLGEFGVELLYNLVHDNKQTHNSNISIDMIYDENLKPLLHETLKYIEKVESESYDYSVVIKPDGDFCRLEDIFRNEIPIIYKGSFNPIHNSHINIAKCVEEKYGRKPFFMISLDTLYKNRIKAIDVLNRIKYINKCGYHVIVNSSGRYLDNMRTIKNRMFEKMIFVMGDDTANRLQDDLLQNRWLFDQVKKNVKFKIFKRKGFSDDWRGMYNFSRFNAETGLLSSTSIRQAKEQGNKDFIKHNIPECIYEDYLND